ncbi:TPA: hypothetical protein ACWP79_005221 [Escherichia coli]
MVLVVLRPLFRNKNNG